MKNYKISFNQPRVNAPEGKEVTKYYAVTLDGDDIVYIVRENKLDEWKDYERVALVEVEHPAVMSGSMQEIDSDFQREVNKLLLAEGVCVENESGTLFVKED